MPTKVSEKKLLLGILVLTSAIIILLNQNLFTAPVRISEKEIASFFIGLALVLSSIKLFKRSIGRI